MDTIGLTTLHSLFRAATQTILDEKWGLMLQAESWQDILPCPDLSVLPKILTSNIALRSIGIYIPTKREQSLQWTTLAMEFVNSHKERINRKLHDIERHLKDELAPWNRSHTEKNEQLPPDVMYREWINTVEKLSLRDFCDLYIGPATASQFLIPKYDELKERYGMYGIHKNKPPVPEKPAVVFISNNVRNKLIKELAIYVEEESYTTLFNLINGEPSTTITVNCQQNKLGQIFYDAYTEGCTQAKKITLVQWICHYFNRQEDGKIFKLTESTMQNHLKGLGFNKD